MSSATSLGSPRPPASQSHRRRDILSGGGTLLTLPIGTHVICRAAVAGQPANAVGVVVGNSDGYRVRFANGAESTLPREEMTIRRQVQRKPFENAPWTKDDLLATVIYRAVVGSRAFGLTTDESDTDVRGIFLPPAAVTWAIYDVPTSIDRGAEELYWEMKHVLGLALRANPNVLECLYTPLVLDTSPLADELRAERSRFLTKQLYLTFSGYALAQFKKLEAGLRTTGALKWKHAMHLLRLLIAVSAALRTGDLILDVGPHRERLLAIGRGELPWAEVDRWRIALHAECDAAYATTRLPELPDIAWANDLLLRARRSVA